MRTVTVRGADFRVEELVSGGIVIQDLQSGKTGFFDLLKKEHARDLIDNDLVVPPWLSLSGMEVMNHVYSAPGGGYAVTDYSRTDIVGKSGSSLESALTDAWDRQGRHGKVSSAHEYLFLVSTDGLGSVFLERGPDRHMVTDDADVDPDVLADKAAELYEGLEDSFSQD